MKILVTGASGMLGANLCSHLVKKGLAVRAFVRTPLQHPLLAGLDIEQALGDLADVASVRAALAGCEQVYHTAGFISYHPRHWSELYSTNVIGTENLLIAARDAGIRRVVYTSSTAAVGIPPRGQAPLDETAVFRKEHERIPYMYSKRLAENLALEFDGLEVISVNPATIYGAGDVKMNTGVVFKKIKEGKLLACPPGGTSVVSVQDCVAGHVLAMEQGLPGKRYILASSQHSYRDLFSRIARTLAVRPPRFTIPWLAAPLAYGGAFLGEKVAGYFGSAAISRHVVTLGFSNRFFSSELARRELGWIPRQSVDEMLMEASRFYVEQKMI